MSNWSAADIRSLVRSCTLWILAAVIFLPGMGFAETDRVLTAVEPAVLQQGDTALLTITGKNIPKGTVVIEFFPQQIALLDILSSNETEVIAQVKVPSLAQPGMYNLLIYNHLGEELFGEAMLEIVSQVITPVFRDFQPKTIGDATNGFALLLTGEAITPDVVSHLTMKWSLNGRKLDNLSTTFSYGSHGQILCAATGPIPGGVLLGKINLDGTPIYLVEVNNQTVQAMIVGQQPTVLSGDSEEYVIRFLGSGFSPTFLIGTEVVMSSSQLTSTASDISLIDNSSIKVSFDGPLPCGDYVISVKNDLNEYFSGNLELVEAAGGISGEQDEIPATPGVANELDPEVESTVGPVLDIPSASVNDLPPAQISGLTPTILAPGTDPASFAFTAFGMTPELYDGLDVVLQMNEVSCELLFLGAGMDSCICMFAAPGDGWVADSIGTLSIVDETGRVAAYSQRIAVSQTALPELEFEEEPAVEDGVTGSDVNEDLAETNAVGQLITIDRRSGLRYSIDMSSGTITPDSLAVDLLADGEVITDTSQINMVFTPVPENPNGAYLMQLTSAGLRILIDLTAWRIEQLNDGLAIQFTSNIPVQWADGPDLLIDSETQSTSESVPGQVSVFDLCTVDNGGFTFQVSVEPGKHATAALGEVLLDCPDSLLQMNIDKFKTEATTVTAQAESSIIELRFSRITGALDEVAYWLMMEQLTGEPSMEITLSWPELNLSVSTDVSFVRDNQSS